MCQILGYVGEKPARIEQAFAHQQKRGPDDDGSWSNGTVHLYHGRLAIVDPWAGQQPMESTRWVLIYNGELYGHMAVRHKLGPMHWPSHCDTLTLLNCIENKGIEWTLNNIEGMFAFAAYDKFNNKLYLAVDPFGIKPCFYHQGKGFGFASTPAALALLQDKWKLNVPALMDMLALGATKEPLFAGILRLPGGHMLTLDCFTGSTTVSKWYKRKLHICKATDVIEAVKISIRESKIADVSGFVFLSGGIDSTVVASQCRHMRAVHLDSPEVSFAREAAEKYGNELTMVTPTNYSAAECLEDYSRQSGDCSMAAIIPYIVSKEAAKYGKFALSANGADELFFGYDRMEYVPRLEQFNHIFRAPISHSWGRHSDYQETRELELDTYVQYDLNKTLDFASMCHSLEVRVPYLNKTVVEMALSLDISEHRNGDGNKSLLKRFLRSEGFGEYFLHRPKVGFSLHTEPPGHAKLKVEGMAMLRNEFGVKPNVLGRDARYYEASAAAFYCWWNVWGDKLSG